AVVKLVGTTIGFEVKVAGSTLVASTIPGRILPTGEPMPGQRSAVPKVLPLAVGGPSVELKPPGTPNVNPTETNPKSGPGLPVHGNAEPDTNGWPHLKKPLGTGGTLVHAAQKGGRKRDAPAIPFGAFDCEGPKIMAIPLPSSPEPKNSCEFGR